MLQQRGVARGAGIGRLLDRNAWYAPTFAVILLSFVVTAEHHVHRSRGLRHSHRTEDGVARDHALEEDVGLTVRIQEVQRSSRSWVVDHSSDDIPIWRPSGGTHHLCPPPSLHHIDPALCDQSVCSGDRDCAVEGTETEASGTGDNETSSYACCYNGCVTTCTKKLEPPIAFDWLEEFRANEGRTDGMPALREDALSVPLQLPARTLPEVIALPGGCVLTAKQYKELEGFRKNVLVNKCFCDRGGISCEVTQVNLSER